MSTVQVEAQTVVVPPTSSIPPLVHALMPMLGLETERLTPHCLWKEACDVLSHIPLDHPFWGESIPVSAAHRDAQVLLFRSSTSMHSPLLSQLLALTVSRQIYIYDWHAATASTSTAPAAPMHMYGVTGTTWFPPLCVAWDGSIFHRLLSPSLTPFQPWLCPTLQEKDVQWRLPWLHCKRCGLFGHHPSESAMCPRSVQQTSGPVRNTLATQTADANPTLRLAYFLSRRLQRLYSVDSRSKRRSYPVDSRSKRRRKRTHTHPI